MKAIEERAKEYCHREKVENIDCLHAYTIGATEQQKIDDEYWTTRLIEYAEDARNAQEQLIADACEVLSAMIKEGKISQFKRGFIAEFANRTLEK